MDKSLISTIIPTMAAPERAHLLKRAIGSIRAASTDPVHIIVVVNGARSDPALCAWLAEQDDVELAYSDMPSAPNATLVGRRLVRTAFFSTLDDDDEYLPHALDLRLAAMNVEPAPDLVVTNGVHKVGEVETVGLSLEGVARDPLAALFKSVWLQSHNGLYRSATVGEEFFADFHPYGEWTWIAFLLANRGRRICVLDQPTFRCNDTPGSLSKTPAYRQAYSALFERMLAERPPAHIADMVRRRAGANWHDQAADLIKRGQRMQALVCHWRSLWLPGGWAYLGFTRKLLPGWTIR